MAIQALFFDLGDVLYHTPSMVWAKRWQMVLGLKNNPTITAVLSSGSDSDYMKDVMIGKIPEAQVWEMVTKQWKINPGLFQRMRRGALSKKRWNKELADFVIGLRPRYKTAILSNAGSDSRKTFNDVFQIEQLVDQVIISAEVGVAKPDERIYQIAIDRLGVMAEEAVFVDDIPENVAAAQRFGMKAIRFLNNPQAIAEVQKFLE
jgi:epoxide hydrolase-like predicted phosphatase